MPLNEKDQFLHDVLTRNDFIVRCTGIAEGSIEVSYAGKFNTLYELYSEDTYGIHYVDVTNKVEEWIDLPFYLLRLYVLADIYRETRLQKLPYGSVWFFDSEGTRKDLNELLPLHLEEEELATELQFHGYMQKIYSGVPLGEFDEQLSKDGLLHTFCILKGLLV